MSSAFLQNFLFPTSRLKSGTEHFFSGKTILISGASFGIGHQIALLLAPFKTHLILVARTQERLEATQNICLQAGAQSCNIFSCDFYDLTQVEQLNQWLKENNYTFDVFISNAGKSIMRSFHDSKDRWQDIHRTIHINFLSPVSIIQNCYDLFRKPGAVLVNVSAMNILMPPTPYWAAYQSSKTAFDQWCQTHAAEWRQDGLHLKTIYLPLVDTRMSSVNKEYSDTPKMSVEQAAIKIIRLITSNQSTSKAWWAFMSRFLFLFKGLWARRMLKHYQR